MLNEPIRILIAEDDSVNAKAVRTMLERLGCTADVAHDGFKAVELFLERPYHLILMGGQMRRMDGFEATVRIRATPRGVNIPVIGTSAGRSRAECLAAGMNDHMPKPFRLETLRPTLARWTSWCECAEATVGD